MDLEELRSVQDAERRKSGLQPLRESFYEEAGEYIASLKAERQRAADRADDPFSSTEVRQITDEIETAEEVLEAIYDRRMGKLLKRASLAAADMSTDEKGLTAEEQVLFDDLVDRIGDNKRRVLETLAGEPNPTPADATGTDRSGTRAQDEASTEASTDSGPTEAGGAGVPSEPAGDRGSGPDPARTGDQGASVDAAAAMSPDGESSSGGGDRYEVDPEPAPEGTPERPAEGDAAPTPDPASGETSDRRPDGGSMAVEPATDRTTVRIKRDLGEIYGVDDKEYELFSEDVVTLPSANAEPLVQRDAAERLD